MKINGKIRLLHCLLRSAFEMLDRFGCEGDFSSGSFDDFSHGLPSVQDFPCLLVLVDVNGHFVYQLLVDLLVLRYKCQKSVNFSIQRLILVQVQEMGLPQFLFFRNDYVKLIFLYSDVCLYFIQSGRKLLSLTHFIIQIRDVFLHFLLVSVGLLVQIIVSQFHFSNRIFQGFQLVLGSFCLVVSLFEFRNQLGVIILCLSQSFIQSGIGGFLVSDLFF